MGAGAWPGDVTAAVAEAFRSATRAFNGHDEATAERCGALLAGGFEGAADPGAVDAAVIAALGRTVATAWPRGWQPADLTRLVLRQYGPRHTRMMIDAHAAAMRGFPAATVDPGWSAQLRALDARVWWERDDRYVTAFGAREGLDRRAVMRHVTQLVFLVGTCPRIELLRPPPGQATARPAAEHRRVHPAGEAPDSSRTAGEAPDRERHLDRVRALLAKAESTTFPQEAEAYAAKAQELMARHSIDAALLAADGGGAEAPGGRRIGIDSPYEAAKALLLTEVCRANRCRAVWSSSLGFATVLGYESDVDAVELLFTSLLTQATAAMLRAGPHQDGRGASRTKSFRRSFLTSYAQRIGERLAEATRRATERAGRDLGPQPTGTLQPAGDGTPSPVSGADRLLPVLASRERAVDEMTGRLFPTVVGKRVSATNREGWASGRAAADLADLHSRRRVAGGGGRAGRSRG